jgi:class 3 adenylate cyclase
MKNSFSARFCRRCLQQSLPVDAMIRFAQFVSPGYDIYRRTGLKEGMPIPNQDAANRIVSDMILDGVFIDFVETLIRVDSEGFMGRQYDLRGLDDVIGDLIRHGYSYDKTTGQFFENQQMRISQNWGRLKEGDERPMTVLRLDIVGNSTLVKQNPRGDIEKAYGDLRLAVSGAVTARLGRIWSWEGDGALGAFMFGQKGLMAVFAGMDILHELFIYNRLKNPLNAPIKIRIGVHSGTVRYSANVTECLKNETVKKAVELESRAASPDSLVISKHLAVSMDQFILNCFGPEKKFSGGAYRQYQVSWERA